MTAERALAIVLFVLSGLLLVRLGPPAWRSWRIYAGTRRRRQHDALGRAPLPTPATVSRIDALTALGFERLGETFVDLPGTGRRFAWQLVHASHTAYAAIVPAARLGALTAIYSAWPDGTWLTTMNPVGETLDGPDLVVQTVPELWAAVERHLARQGELAARHGPPRRIATMTDLLAFDADYRRLHGGRTLVRPTARIVLPALLAAAVVGVSFALLVVSPR